MTTPTTTEGDRAREIATEQSISVSKARRIVARDEQARRRADRRARGVKAYEFRPLNATTSQQRRLRGGSGEFVSDRAAEDACAAMVAADGITRQVICEGSLVRLVVV